MHFTISRAITNVFTKCLKLESVRIRTKHPASAGCFYRGPLTSNYFLLPIRMAAMAMAVSFNTPEAFVSKDLR